VVRKSYTYMVVVSDVQIVRREIVMCVVNVRVGREIRVSVKKKPVGEIMYSVVS